MSKNPSEEKEPPREEKETKLNFYVHYFIEKEKEGEETKGKAIINSVKIVTTNKNLKVMDLKMDIAKKLEMTQKTSNMHYTPISVSKSIFSPPLKDTTKINLYFEDQDDIFVKLDAQAVPIAVSKETKKDDVLLYKNITDYSFYVSSDTTVKVLVPIPGIEKVKKENIVAHFEEESLEIKINSPIPNGTNYRFAVKKLYQKIIPEKSDAFPKGDRLIIRLRKFKNEDGWSYLYS
ncbi:MAG: hypothetical protein MJ252_00655 [archaeon]|nr:hypothetical protein [archaeon]